MIFDIDGTLVQSAAVDDALYRQAVTAILGPVHFRPSMSDYDLVTDSGILTQLLDDNDLDNIPDPTPTIRSHFVELLEHHISKHGPFPETPGARDYLAALHRSDRHSVAIATGGWHASALLKLSSAGFDISSTPIATADDHADRTRIMLSALSKLGSEFESVTYYGDGIWDQNACVSLGWQFVPVGQALNGLDSFSAVGVGRNYE